MRFWKYLRFSLLLPVLVHCGTAANDPDDEGPSEECRNTCEERCDAFAGCGLAARPACVDECTASLAHVDCEWIDPASQLTCAELEEVHACVSYCADFCARVPECGSFSQELCLEGCVEAGPVICNPASVPPRTCDQLKPEARLYEDTGRALQSDNVAVGHGGLDEHRNYGLCRDASDCEATLACSLATNTCGACVQDADCERGFGDAFLCSSGECVEVECVTDDDCLLDFCDTATHTCVRCRTDADCGNFFCEPLTRECVECTSDTHCTSTLLSRCDTPQTRCVECLSDLDCTDSSFNVCSESGLCSLP